MASRVSFNLSANLFAKEISLPTSWSEYKTWCKNGHSFASSKEAAGNGVFLLQNSQVHSSNTKYSSNTVAQADQDCYVHKLGEICLNNKLVKCDFTSLKVSSMKASEFRILDLLKQVLSCFRCGPLLASLLNALQHCFYFILCFLAAQHVGS